MINRFDVIVAGGGFAGVAAALAAAVAHTVGCDAKDIPTSTLRQNLKNRGCVVD